MTGGTLIVLEDGITLNLLGCHGVLVALEIAVEGRIGGEKRLLILGDGVGDGLLIQTLGI